MAKSHEAWYRLKVQARRSASQATMTLSFVLMSALFAGSLWWNSA